MAEPIGVASGLLALEAFAFKSSSKLYETIQTFSSHPRQVRELLAELSALSVVLQKLSQLFSTDVDVDLSALRLTLEQCDRACTDFESELVKYSSRCTEDRTSFRDWTRFKHSGCDSIDGFRQQLIGYKATINMEISTGVLKFWQPASAWEDGYQLPLHFYTVLDLIARRLWRCGWVYLFWRAT
jgi:hypothetical protein